MADPNGNFTVIGASPKKVANAATIDNPMLEISAKLGNLAADLTTDAKTKLTAAVAEVDSHADQANARIGAAASGSGSIGTSIDTDGTLKAGAVDVTGVLANDIVTNDKMATDVKIGSLAGLHTTANSTVVAALNKALRPVRNLHFTTTTPTWDPTAKTLTFSSNAFIYHGDVAHTYTRISPGVIDFTGHTTGFAYIKDVTLDTTQTAYDFDTATVVEYDAVAEELFQDPAVIVVAKYSSGGGGKIWTPFADDVVVQRVLKDLGAMTSLKAVAQNTLVDAINEAMRMLYLGWYETAALPTWDPDTKVLTFSGYCYFFHGTDDIYTRIGTPGLTIDFSGVTGTYLVAYITGMVYGTTQTGLTGNLHIEAFDGLTHNLLEGQSCLVIATFHNASGGIIYSPFITSRLQTAQLTSVGNVAVVPWVNHYPQIYSKLAPFLQKMLAPTGHLRVLLWGDSIFARTQYVTALADPTATPPFILGENIYWYLYQQMPFGKATYRRYDYTGYFTEVGTWASSQSSAHWDDAGDRPGWTRIAITASEAASFAWTLGTSDDESGCNLIYRTDTSGDAAATVAVTEGDGYLEYWTGAAWAEANGHTFSELDPNTGTYHGNTTFGLRLELRKAAAHQNDSVTITVSKATSDADWLLYWGVELWDAKNSKYILLPSNESRGSHTFDQTAGLNLIDYMADITALDPDLVIVEIPLLNMIAADGADIATIVNSVQDTIWGDRGGHTNSYALKEVSNDWADFQVILTLPHNSQDHFNADSTWAEVFTDVTALQVYNAVKALIYSKGDVGYVDISTAMRRAIDANASYAGDYYTGLAASSPTGATYLSDGTHQNKRGTEVYASELCPIFDCNTL